jgi:hypothetical protein
MLFSISRVALVSLSLTAISAAGPAVKEREVQERDLIGNATPLLTSIATLTGVLNTAQAFVSTLQSSGGITALTVGVSIQQSVHD